MGLICWFDRRELSLTSFVVCQASKTTTCTHAERPRSREAVKINLRKRKLNQIEYTLELRQLLEISFSGNHDLTGCFGELNSFVYGRRLFLRGSYHSSVTMALKPNYNHASLTNKSHLSTLKSKSRSKQTFPCCLLRKCAGTQACILLDVFHVIDYCLDTALAFLNDSALFQ